MGVPKTVENDKPSNPVEDERPPSPAENERAPDPVPVQEVEKYTVKDAFNADIILGLLGRFGKFQMKYVITIGYSLMFTTAAILIYTFVGGVPKHRCFVEGCDDPDNPEYFADWLNETALSNLEMFPKAPFWRCNYRDFGAIPNTSTPSCAVNYTANATCNNWVFDDSVFTKTIVIDYNLVCNDSWKITFGSFITMLGILVGAFLLGPLPDLIGRRISVVVLALWFSGFGIASCFVPNFDAFVSLRFISAMGGIALMQALIIWGLEAMTPAMRIPFICTIYCCQGLGNLISGLLAYFIRNWVTLQLCIFVPLGSLAFSYFILPESTRWLTVKKKYAAAKEIYEKAAKLNKKDIPPELLTIPCDEKNAIEVDPEASAQANRDSNPLSSALQVLKTRCLLIRLLIMCSTWLAQFLCYYGLSYAASNLSSNIHLNYILVMLVEIPAYITGMFALNILGRRLILNLTLLLGGSFCLVAGLVSKELSTVIIVFSLMGKFCTAMLTVANNAFAFELFPTVSRGITIALCSTSGKIGAVIAPYIAALGATNRSLPYIIFGAISLAVGVLSLLLPESKGKPVPSTIQEAIDLEETRIDLIAFFRKRCCGAKPNSSDTSSDAS